MKTRKEILEDRMSACLVKTQARGRLRSAWWELYAKLAERWEDYQRPDDYGYWDYMEDHDESRGK